MNNIFLNDYTNREIYAVHDIRRAINTEYCADCYLAVYAAHGGGTFKTEGNSCSVSEGDIFLLRPNLIHSVVPHKGLRRIDIYCCCFSQAAVKELVSDFAEAFSDSADFWRGTSSFIRAADTENKEIRDIFIRMINEQISSQPCSYNALTGYFQVLLTKILRNEKTRDFTRVYSRNSTIDNAVKYINSRIYMKVSLNDIAAHMNVSPSYMCRLFKKHMGMTTAKFVNMLRIEKMKDVLKNTDRPAANVTEMFVMNSDYLAQLFRQKTGMTVQEYYDKYNYKIITK